ncbi:MAG TPA: hypothetical protein VMU02_10240 [bacterium]|nr:hypothetical protein [bacterium]
MRFTVLILLVLLAGGCNLFSPFYDEGKSNDRDDIIGDVQAALERGEPDKAYEYASRGIEKYPGCASLYYLGAVAKVQSSDVGFTDFASMLRSENKGQGGYAAALSAFQRGLAQGDTTWFLDLSPDDLARMAGAFSVSYDYLDSVLTIIARPGGATKEEIEQFQGDSQLGLGISGLMKTMLTVLDQDHNLDNGFVLSPTIRAFRTATGGWSFTATLDPAVICGAWDWLETGQEALYDHYRTVVGGTLPEDIPTNYLYVHVEDWTDPQIDTGTLSGEFFESVHDGMVDFHGKYSCSGEVSRHE